MSTASEAVKVTEPVQTPLVNEPDTEGLIDPELTFRRAVPTKPVTVLPETSLAVIVMLNELPAVTKVGD